MKNRKLKTVSVILAIILIVGLLAVPASATAWNWRIQKMNDIWYDVETVLGRGSTDAVTAAVRDGFYAENGTNCTGSYYYSARENKTYYFGGGSINGRPTDENTGGEKPTGYWDEYGQYWYWDPSSGYYYRIDQWGNRIWGSRTGGSTTGGGTTGKNISGYDYYYRGVPLYSGLITVAPVNIGNNVIQALARLVDCSKGTSTSKTEWSSYVWSALFCAGDPSKINDTWLKNTYSWYKSDITPSSESIEIANDVCFRWEALKAGNTYVGCTVTKNHSWMCHYNNGYTSVRTEQYGADYTFPDAWSTTKSTLHTPYST